MSRNWTEQQYQDYLQRTHDSQHHSKLPNPKPEPHKKNALDSAVSGKEESMVRVGVRFVGFRVRPLDPDNFAASCKDLLDGLRHAQLIPGDEPWRIKLETEQVKVSSYKQEKTVIEICL